MSRGDLRHDVDEPAAVAPLVVVPAEHLRHRPVRHRQVAVDDARVRRVHDVGGNERIVRVAKDPRDSGPASAAARYAAFTSSTGHLAAEAHDEIGDRAGRDRRAHRDPVDLALQVGQHEADRACGAGGRRNEVDRRGACAAQVLVRKVEDLLVVRVRVDRSVMNPCSTGEVVVQRPARAARRSSSCKTRSR